MVIHNLPDRFACTIMVINFCNPSCTVLKLLKYTDHFSTVTFSSMTPEELLNSNFLIESYSTEEMNNFFFT